MRLLLASIVALIWLMLPARHARAADSITLEVQFDTHSEYRPDEVCLYAEALDEQVLDGPERLTPEGASVVGEAEPSPAGGADHCPNSCTEAPRRLEGYHAVCRSFGHPGAGRRLDLRIGEARLIHLALLADSRLQLQVAYSLGQMQPTLTVLGGSYHMGRTIPLERQQPAVTVPLVPRCVIAELNFPIAPDEGCIAPKVNGKPMSISRGGRQVLDRVCEPTGNNAHDQYAAPVELEWCGTVYKGEVHYPPAPVQLATHQFAFSWTRSCFISDASTFATCPAVSLPGQSHACQSQVLVNSCRYTCQAARGVEFPVQAEFKLQRSRPFERNGLEPVTWKSTVVHPGETVQGFAPPEERRVVLLWRESGVTGNGRRSTRFERDRVGVELDFLEVVGPDGRVQRVLIPSDDEARAVRSLLVPELQCGDYFRYRYSGRRPHETVTIQLDGDVLRLDGPAQSRQKVVAALRLHAGAFAYSGLGIHGSIDRAATWSPVMDAELAFQHHSGWELASSFILGFHPSVSASREYGAAWELDAVTRLAILVGRVWYPDKRWYAFLGAGPGLVFPPVLDGWKNGIRYGIGVARARIAYEITRAISLDMGLWLTYPERYVSREVTRADEILLENERIERAFGFGLTAGLQWTDVLH